MLEILCASFSLHRLNSCYAANVSIVIILNIEQGGAGMNAIGCCLVTIKSNVAQIHVCVYR